MGLISYENKVELYQNNSIPDKNKITANDMNEIKEVVNDNANSTLFFEVAAEDDD